VSASVAVDVGVREDLALATRMLAMLGLLGYSGHVSARVGPGADAFLIQPFDADRATLAPDELLVVSGASGEVLDGDARPVDEVELHRQILLARPEVGAVAHVHGDRATAFTLVSGGAPLVPLKNHACRWRSGIPVHADPSHINAVDQAQALADTLGPHHAVQLRAHGQVLVAEDVRAVFADAVHFFENVELALTAASLGGRLEPLSDAELDAFEATFNRSRHTAKLWRHFVGRADRVGIV